jgi:hypothetical protein
MSKQQERRLIAAHIVAFLFIVYASLVLFSGPKFRPTSDSRQTVIGFAALVATMMISFVSVKVEARIRVKAMRQQSRR